MIEVLNILVLLYFVLLTAGYIALFIAAVVGVILNLTVTFAIDVLSPTAKERWSRAPISLAMPSK